MTYDELKSYWRKLSGDDVEPYLFCDETLDTAANEAIREAVYRGKLIRDASNAMTQLAITASTASYDLNSKIFQIERVTINGNTLQIRAQSHLDRNIYKWGEKTGTPTDYVPDVETGTILFYPKPDAAYTAKLTVFRYPLADDDLSELPVFCHADLKHWIDHIYYSQEDIDHGDPKLSLKAESLFTQRFGPRLNHNSQAFMLGNAPMTAGTTPLA
jgi:hypothetical protein